VYIPKSESADEALWWRDLFPDHCPASGACHDAIKCMALGRIAVRSHSEWKSLMESSRSHMGLNLAVGNYMASLIHFKSRETGVGTPDRNPIPHVLFPELAQLIPNLPTTRLLAIGA